MSINPDLLLWKRFLSGDDNAYTAIYRLYVQRMYSYGMNFSTDKEFVKDCIQDVFTRMYSNRKSLGVTDNIQLYLYVALKNRIIEQVRKKNRYHDINLDEQSLNESQLIADQEASDPNALQEKIRVMISALTPRQREAIYYRYVDDLPYEEITKLMGMNYQSVHNLIQRAIKKLRQLPEMHD